MKIYIKDFSAESNDQGVPVYVFGTHKGTRRKRLLFRIHQKHWNSKIKRVKRTSPRYNAYNKKINDTLHELKTRALETSNLDIIFGSEEETIAETKTIVSLLEEYKDNRHRIGKEAGARSYKAIIFKVKNYYKKPFPLDRFNRIELESFHAHIRNELAINTAAKMVQRIKTAIRYARDRNYKVDLSTLDFTATTIKTRKEKLTEQEFRKVEELDLTGNLDLSRDVFIFQVYMRGLRISNALQARYSSPTHYEERDVKTGKMNKIKYREEVLRIIEKYKGKTHNNRIFPCVKNLSDVSTWTSIVNINLKKIMLLADIDKPVSSHTARHTFAALAEAKGVPVRKIKDLLNHSSIEQTERYLLDLKQDDILDQATDQVFD